MSGQRVSVVIPVRDAERYIGQAIESVLGQDPMPAELIVVDHRSTDSSAAAAEGFGPPVRVIEGKGATISTVVNAGLRAASGEILGLLDADDLWAPRALASRLPLFARSPAPDLVWGRVRHFLSPELDPEVAQRLHCPEGATPGHLPSGLLLTRAAFDRFGPFTEELRTGYLLDWMARARDAGLREAATDDVVLLRRVHGDNYTLRNRAAAGDTARALKIALDRRRAAARGPG